MKAKYMELNWWYVMVILFFVGLLFLKWFLALAGDLLHAIYWRFLTPAQKERYLQHKLARAEGVKEYELNREKALQNQHRFK
jgi:hypothetical protein